MARNDYESSAELGQPVELYEIRHGETAALRYTSAEAPITYDGEVYTPHPITRSEIEAEGKLETEALTITVPLDSPLALVFTYPPSRVVPITIREGHVAHVDAPSEWAAGENFPVSYSGRVLESRRNGNKAELTCDPTTLRRPGLTRNYQWGCPHALYEQGPGLCNANKAAATQAATVESVDGNVVALVDGWNLAAHPDTYFTGGLFEWDGTLGREVRLILSATGNTFRLSGPVWDLAADGAADVVLGCPHTREGCTTVHNNAPNYGGQPWIPASGNPIGKNNHFGG